MIFICSFCSLSLSLCPEVPLGSKWLFRAVRLVADIFDNITLVILLNIYLFTLLLKSFI